MFEVREGTNKGETLEDEEARVEEEVGDIGTETRVGETEARGAKPVASSLVAGLWVTNRPLERSLGVVGLTHGPVIGEGEGTEEFPNRWNGVLLNDILVLGVDVLSLVGDVTVESGS